jgi:hypothetical protein
MAMNGHVRLGATYASLQEQAPPAPTTLPVEQTELIGLVGGVGLFAGGTQVKGEAGLLMKVIGLIAAAASGYVIATKKAVIPDVLNVGTSPATANTGLLSPTGMGPLKPLAPGAPAPAAGGGRSSAAQDAMSILTPFAPVLQRLIAPSQPQPTTTAAQRQQAQIVSASAPVATAAARAVTSGGSAPAPAPAGPQSNPYGIVTEADLERSLQTPSTSPLNNPYGLVTEADLQRTITGPTPPASNPYGFVTEQDLQGPSAPSNTNPYGFVTESDVYGSSPATPEPVTTIEQDFGAPSMPSLPVPGLLHPIETFKSYEPPPIYEPPAPIPYEPPVDYNYAEYGYTDYGGMDGVELARIANGS